MTADPAPALPTRLLARTRLLDELDGVLRRPVTLITAPAGYGKTTAAAHWCALRCPAPVTWLRTDPDAAALPAPAPGGSPQVVVVDALDGDDAGPQLRALVDATLPRTDLHLLVLSRRQLADDVAALRLRGDVHVLRTRDLRLQPDETGELLGLHTGAAVEPALAEAVTNEVEGWVAGVVLVALDWDRAATAKDHRAALAAGYRSATALIASLVLKEVEPPVEDFLRQAACLPELSGPLCDRVLGRTGSAPLLADLEVRGLFLEPSRSSPELLRLHPLARRALRGPGSDGRDEVTALRAAATWYEEQKQPLLGAACLAEAQDWDAMAGMLLTNLHDLLMDNRLPDVARFMTASVPGAVLQARFMWTAGVATSLLMLGDLPGMLALLATVEPAAEPAQLVVLHFLRVAAVAALEDPTTCLESGERALALCDEVGEDATYDDLYTISRTSHWRAQARAGVLLCGAVLGQWQRVERHDVPVDPSVAVEIPPGGMVSVRGRRAIYLALSGQASRADDEVKAGEALVPPDDEYATAIGSMLFGLARSFLELDRGNHEAVLTQAAIARERATGRNLHNFIAASVAAQTQAHVDAGRPDEALAVLDDWRRSTTHRPPPVLAGFLVSAEALALAATGQSALARTVVTAGPPTAVVAAAAAQLALEQGDVAATKAVLAAWPDEPTARSEVGRHLLRAAVAETTGARVDATAHLEQALAAAAPDQILAPFLRLGALLVRPLRIVEAGDGPPAVLEHARVVIAAIDRDGGAVRRLSNRERLVLERLVTAESMPVLAEQLGVSINTVKSQVRSIYRKLGVASRAEALAALAANEPLTE